MLATRDSEESGSNYEEIARQPLKPEQSALLVIDIQEKLLPPIFQKEQLVRNAQLLIRMAEILEMPGEYDFRRRFSSARRQRLRKVNIFLLRERRFLLRSQALAGQSKYRLVVRDGKPHLRRPICLGGTAGRLPCACGVGCGEFANGMELEDWARPYASRRGSHHFHGDGDL